MKKYSHILVALDLSSIDRTLIRNSAVLADVMQVLSIISRNTKFHHYSQTT